MEVPSDSKNEAIDPINATELFTQLTGVQATTDLQSKDWTPSLEDPILKSIDRRGRELLDHKNNFASLPGSVLERMSREFGQRWRQPPLANLLVHPHSRHLSLHLTPTCLCVDYCLLHGLNDLTEPTGWTVQDLDTLCEDVVRDCEYTLHSLEIENPEEPPGNPEDQRDGHPGLTAAQLCSLVQRLHGLTTMQLEGYFRAREVHQIICALASSNHGIRHLHVPCLNTVGLNMIVDSWPELETLGVNRTLFNSTHLAAALVKLTKLRKLNMDDAHKKTRAFWRAAQADLSSAPYPMLDIDDEKFFAFLHGAWQ